MRDCRRADWKGDNAWTVKKIKVMIKKKKQQRGEVVSSSFLLLCAVVGWDLIGGVFLNTCDDHRHTPKSKEKLALKLSVNSSNTGKVT